MLLVVPGGLFELILLPLWLIAMGFRPLPATPTSAPRLWPRPTDPSRTAARPGNWHPSNSEGRSRPEPQGIHLHAVGSEVLRCSGKVCLCA